MTAPRKLAYRGNPADAYPEAAWVNARRWLQGETETAAKAAIQQDIAAGKIVVVETEG